MHTYSSLRLITSLLIVVIKVSDAYRPQNNRFGTEFQLLHRNQLSGRDQPNQSESIRQMLYGDTVRMERIRQKMPSWHDNEKQHPEDLGTTFGRRRLQKRAETTDVAAVSPIISGSDYKSGEYFVELRVGTPPKKLLLVADTGSDLTWVNCKYKGKGSRRAQNVFDADHSTSFQTISCLSKYCRDDLHDLFSYPCKKGNGSCVYKFDYHGAEYTARGIFANENVTFSLTNGKQETLKNALIGCTTSSSQSLDPVVGAANGVMGLSNTRFSLPKQASKLFGNMFSYCLVDMFSHKTKSSKLIFGRYPGKPKSLGKMQSTKLELEAVIPYYGLYVQSISIKGGKPLNISASTWDFTAGGGGGGGAIIDSGSTLTFLLESAYKPVMHALTKPLKINTTAGPFQYCYMSNVFKRESAVAMEIGFVGGASLVVPASSYLIAIRDESGDDNKELTCLGIVNAGEGGLSMIGNLWQQNHLWEFDIQNGKLNFGTSDCAYWFLLNKH